MITSYFLHGLDSSGMGTKGRFFASNFPSVIRPDFHGSLAERMAQLEDCCKEDAVQLIGSSYGGLMATHFAIRNRERVKNLILLAPALNYEDYRPPRKRLAVPTYLLIGKNDTVTPVDPVVELAQKSFARLELAMVDDDHLLHKSFADVPWQKLLH